MKPQNDVITQETTNEKWLPVKGFEGYYEVSNKGNIRRTKSKRVRAISHTNCYSHILLCKNGEHTTLRVHRLVAEAFLPEIEGKNHVNHINGNKNDNRVENLQWVTQAENNLHAYRSLHRVPSQLGKTPPNKKVKDEDIAIFDELNKKGVSTENIGKIYHIDGSTIRKHLRKYRNHEHQ